MTDQRIPGRWLWWRRRHHQGRHLGDQLLHAWEPATGPQFVPLCGAPGAPRHYVAVVNAELVRGGWFEPTCAECRQLAMQPPTGAPK